MNDNSNKALLPAGLQDLLPPEAAREAAAVEALLASFAAQGYERVKPPLIEFEEALLSGAGAALANQTFRLMDPVSQRMMGLRADITTQVARVAASRLAAAPRPLRLAYAGQVLRIRGSQLRPERQFGQAGAELIGVESAAAEAEVILLAWEALAALGAAELSVDLTLPTLVPLLLAELGLGEAALRDLRHALDRKDAAEVERLAGDGKGAPLVELLQATGPAPEALATLGKLALPQTAQREVAGLKAVVDLLSAAAPGLAVTVDPVEHRGFEYQTGLSFVVFSKGVRGELGRGGRYVIEPASGEGEGEPAIGFTLYMDTVLRALPPQPEPRRLFLRAGSDPAEARRLRSEGWVTLAGLDEGAESPADARAEAVRLGCSHVWLDGKVVALED